MGDWVTKALGKGFNAPSAADEIDESLLDEEMVILLQGDNAYGDPIYSYLKLTVRSMRQLTEHVKVDKEFTPSAYGTILAAGQGTPPPELHAEMAATYNLQDIVPPAPKKPNFNFSQPKPSFWDED